MWLLTNERALELLASQRSGTATAAAAFAFGYAAHESRRLGPVYQVHQTPLDVNLRIEEILTLRESTRSAFEYLLLIYTSEDRRESFTESLEDCHPSVRPSICDRTNWLVETIS